MGPGRDRRHSVAAGAGPDRGSSLSLVEPGACADAAAVQSKRRRSEDNAELRPVVLNEADVHGIVVAAANELPGAVERVDQEIGLAVLGNAPRGHLFLGYYRNPWGSPRQRRENDQLGCPVSVSDGGRISFGLGFEAAADNLQNRLPRLARRLGKIVEEAGVVAHQRGAIRMPPSRRIAAAFMYGFSIRKHASRAYSSAWPSLFGKGTCAPSAS